MYMGRGLIFIFPTTVSPAVNQEPGSVLMEDQNGFILAKTTSLLDPHIKINENLI